MIERSRPAWPTQWDPAFKIIIIIIISRAQCLMPVILVTQEVEIGRIGLKASPGSWGRGAS
jgi:hypothetical protein